MKTLIGCCLIHLCIGSVYALSVLYPTLSNWSTTSLVMGFSLTIMMLGITASVHQRLLEQHHQTNILKIGVLVWGISQFGVLLSWDTNIEWAYYVCCMTLGTGIGLLYVIPINIIANYGYHYMGRATGSVVCCFGLGSIIATKLFLLVPLYVLYITYVIIMFVGTTMVQGKVITNQSLFVKDKQWYTYTIVFFLNIGIGISLLSNLVQLSTNQGLTTGEAITLVALVGLTNTIGRLVYASISDYIGKHQTIQWLLYIQFLALLGMYECWTLSVMVIISVYGGVFALMPGLMKETYQSTVPYSQALSVWGFAGLVCPIMFSQLGVGMLLAMSLTTIVLIHIPKYVKC